jgi:predicted branched-subunit amino acid permease
MLSHPDPQWRLGYYLGPSLWSWLLWQVFAFCGVMAAGSIPRGWSLEFMATIALIVLLVPMARVRPMLVAALVGGGLAVALQACPCGWG